MATLSGVLAFSSGPAVGVPLDGGRAGVEAARNLATALFVFPGFTEILDSRALTTSVIMQGTLKDPAGKPLRNAQVLLAAWPSSATVSRMPKQSFSIAPLAKAVTDGAGRYVLRSEATEAILTRMDADGLDVELDVFVDRKHIAYPTQIKRETISSLGAQLVGGPAPTARNIVLDPAGNPTIEPGEPGDHAPVNCSTWDPVDSTKGWETVATGIASNGVLLKAVYLVGAKSEVGSGLSKTTGASFSAGSVYQRTSTIEAGWDDKAVAGKTVHMNYQVRRSHNIRERHCPIDYRGGFKVQRSTTPATLDGGVRPAKGDRSTYFTCTAKTTVPANASYVSTQNDRAYTYQKGFSLPVIGFTGTSQSGYNTSTRVVFEFKNKNISDRQWCGHSDYPIRPGQRVRAEVKGGS